ncbi:hypothetical protein MPER_01823 [Moniliophthora perniciosa FA553]|nr:hypothetical protein MPER_01823 [Moniliophthora perniciosa FA553]
MLSLQIIALSLLAVVSANPLAARATCSPNFEGAGISILGANGFVTPNGRGHGLATNSSFMSRCIILDIVKHDTMSNTVSFMCTFNKNTQSLHPRFGHLDQCCPRGGTVNSKPHAAV